MLPLVFLLFAQIVFGGVVHFRQTAIPTSSAHNHNSNLSPLTGNCCYPPTNVRRSVTQSESSNWSGGFVPWNRNRQQSHGPAPGSMDSESRMSDLRMTITRYGFPFIDHSTRMKMVQKLRNLPPEPYVAPSTISKKVAKITTNPQPPTQMIINHQNLHHYPGNSVAYRIDHTLVPMHTTPPSIVELWLPITDLQRRKPPNRSGHHQPVSSQSLQSSMSPNPKPAIRKRKQDTRPSSGLTNGNNNQVRRRQQTANRNTHHQPVPSPSLQSSSVLTTNSNRPYVRKRISPKKSELRRPTSRPPKPPVDEERTSTATSSSTTTPAPVSELHVSDGHDVQGENVIVKLMVPDEVSSSLYYSGTSSYGLGSSSGSGSASPIRGSTSSSPLPTTYTSFSFPSSSTSSLPSSQTTFFPSSPTSRPSSSSSLPPSSPHSWPTSTTQIPSTGSITTSVGSTVKVIEIPDITTTTIHDKPVTSSNLQNHRLSSTIIYKPTTPAFTTRTSGTRTSDSSTNSGTSTTRISSSSTTRTAGRSTNSLPATTTVTSTTSTTTTTTPAPSSSYLYYEHEDTRSNSRRRTSPSANLSYGSRLRFQESYLPIIDSENDLVKLGQDFASTFNDSRPIFDPMSLQTNRTDHTILNHILSLIAIGETPPEVKIFTKPMPSKPSVYSTHVEIHKEMRARSRRAANE